MPAHSTNHLTTSNSRFVRGTPFFYGWIVWVVATLGLIGTVPGQSFTVSLFIDKFITEFDLSRTTVSGLYGAGTFLAALALTWVGGRIDQYGNRATGVVIGVLFALALVFMSFVNGPLMLLVGFIMIRGLGQGSLNLVSSTAVANWFYRRRGLMMSLMFVGFALFQGLYLPQLEALLSRYDWRTVWLILAAGIALVIIPSFGLLMRNRPEDFDLIPDGGQPDTETADGLDEDNWTLGEARRTGIFWVFLFGRVLSPAWGTGLIIHQVSIFQTLGYERQVAAQVFGVASVLTAVFALGVGYLLDRSSPGKIMSLQLGGLVLAMVMAMGMSQNWMLALYAAGFGLTMGGGAVFDGSVWPTMFGRLHQGRIRGFVTTALVTGTSIGPLVFGLSYDLAGSYVPVLIAGVVLAVMPLIAAPLMSLPPHAAIHQTEAE